MGSFVEAMVPVQEFHVYFVVSPMAFVIVVGNAAVTPLDGAQDEFPQASEKLYVVWFPKESVFRSTLPASSYWYPAVTGGSLDSEKYLTAVTLPRVV